MGKSIYDVEPTAEEDLWFLAAPQEDAGPQDFPWEIADRAPAFDAQEWRDGEARHYRGLVAASSAVSRLGERVKAFPDALKTRLAMTSVTGMLRSEGIWLGADQIALYQMGRLGGVADTHGLTRAGWAVRRLTGTVDPLDGLHGFLGRVVVDIAQDIPGLERPVGEELAALSHQWVDASRGLEDVHPITRAAFAIAQWRALDVAPFEDFLEPCVAGMLIGAGCGSFLPLGAGYRMGGELLGFYRAVEQGALEALLMLDRLANWQMCAQENIAGLSGRTPAKLVGCLMKYPLVSAELVAADVGCSRAAARRNLVEFQERNIIREATGQDRYRFWTAKL